MSLEQITLPLARVEIWEAGTLKGKGWRVTDRNTRYIKGVVLRTYKHERGEA